jgi:hypothetical protein
MSDEPRWYSVNTIGMATLCRGEAGLSGKSG